MAIWALAGLATAQWASIERAAEKVLSQAPGTSQQEIAEDRKFEILSAREFSRQGDLVRAEGNVRFRFREYEGWCDRMEGSVQNEVFEMFGNATIKGTDVRVSGEYVRLDAKQRLIAFRRARGQLEPSLLDGVATAPLYVRGSGEGTEARFTLTETGCTTCDLDHPHWEIRAKTVDVRPNDVIILRGASLRVGKSTLLTVPYLSLPLNESLPRYLPEVGSSPDEGYFVKTRFGLDTKGTDLLDARLDLMTRRGIGVGADFRYALGALSAYGLLGNQRSLTVNQEHRQTLGGGQFEIQNSYARQNYLTAPQNTTWSLRSTYAIAGQRLTFNRSTTESNTFRSENQNLGVNLQGRVGGWQVAANTNLTQSLSRATAGSQFRTDRSVLELRSRATRPFKSLDLELLYDRTIPVSEIVGFFNSGDQTPLAQVRSDTKRLLGWTESLPILLSVGELVDPVRRRPISRILFETSLNRWATRSGRAGLAATGRFRQALYSDNTAQFLFGGTLNADYRLTPTESINLNYTYLRPQGFTPLAVDRSGRTDTASLEFTAPVARSLKFGLGAGYDLLDRPGKITPWQTVVSRLEYRPSDALRASVVSTYDPFNQLWQSVRTEFNYQLDDLRLAVGARYDGSRSTWGSINVLADGLRWGRLGVSALWNYNGYTKRLDSQQYALTYDMHCTEAILNWTENRTGFRNGRFIEFTIRIKALPFRSPFGTGTRGQQLGGLGGFNF